MKIVALLGSPRKGGNTDVLADALLRGARKEGAEVEKIALRDRKIAPCRACYGCKKSGKCVIEDDMAGVLKDLLEADVWVFATPVYWWGPSAQLKLALDRMFPFCHADNGLPARVKGKRFVLVTASEDDPKKAAPHVVGMMKEAMKYLGLQWSGQLLCQAYKRGEAAEDEKTMRAAAALGARLAKGR
jgi:multimeric flavodoxin WrbA